MVAAVGLDHRLQQVIWAQSVEAVRRGPAVVLNRRHSGALAAVHSGRRRRLLVAFLARQEEWAPAWALEARLEVPLVPLVEAWVLEARLAAAQERAVVVIPAPSEVPVARRPQLGRAIRSGVAAEVLAVNLGVAQALIPSVAGLLRKSRARSLLSRLVWLCI